MQGTIEPTPESITRQPQFLLVWAGQTLSVVGSQMCGFALSIWIFGRTGSVMQFGAVIAFQLIPAILFAPLAGSLIDRYPRKNVMIWCEIGSLLVVGALLAVSLAGRLDIVSILAISPILAVLAAAHQLAYATSIPLLVPRVLYGKANGLVHLGVNASAVAVPLITVVVLEALGIDLILLINALSYGCAALTLLIAKMPPRKRNPDKVRPPLTARGLLVEQGFGLRYLLEHRELGALLIFSCAVSFLNGIVHVLFRPMILTTQPMQVIGWLATAAGAGGLIGAVLAGMLASRRNKVGTLIKAAMVVALALITCGVTTHNWLIAFAAFMFAFCIPVITVTGQTIWQTLVPSEVQGRVFAARAFCVGTSLLIAVVLSPVLAASVFEPLMSGAGGLSGILGEYLGTGPGRGMALLFVVNGLLMIAVTAIASRSTYLRQVSNTEERLQPAGKAA